MTTNNKNGSSLKIYARLRKIMPWENDRLSTTAISATTIINKSCKLWKKNDERYGRITSYDFTEAFTPASTNQEVYESICQPLLSQILVNSYNAILIAYGQTGSGKTYSVLGKYINEHESVDGLLQLSLQYLLQSPKVKKVLISAVETFGHHLSKVKLYDLADVHNLENEEWKKKRGSTRLKTKEAITIELHDIYDIRSTINKLHNASHFAPTGKNPESSRGHISYITHVYLNNSGARAEEEQIAYWIVVDLAGSEGESAITPDFKQRVPEWVVQQRRLEASCINHGLSQLQMIFKELRGKKKKTVSIGTGLKRTMYEFISNHSLISVLFTISPSIDNWKSTESTLRFAESAALVKCTPIKAEKKINKEQLIERLKRVVQQQQLLIDTQNDHILAMEKKLPLVDETLDADGSKKGKLSLRARDNSDTVSISTSTSNEPGIKNIEVDDEVVGRTDSLSPEDSSPPAKLLRPISPMDQNYLQNEYLAMHQSHKSSSEGRGASLNIPLNSMGELDLNKYKNRKLIRSRSTPNVISSDIWNQLQFIEKTLVAQKAEDEVWTAHDEDKVSSKEELEMEQIMSVQLSDERRNSRCVMYDDMIDINKKLKYDQEIIDSNEEYIESINRIQRQRSSLNGMPTVPTIIEMEDDDDEDEIPALTLANINNKYQSINNIKIQKLLRMKGVQELDMKILETLNIAEFVHLCKGLNNERYELGIYQNETNSIIEHHEQQIQWLKMELNRIQLSADEYQSLEKQHTHINIHMIHPSKDLFSVKKKSSAIAKVKKRKRRKIEIDDYVLAVEESDDYFEEIKEDSYSKSLSLHPKFNDDEQFDVFEEEEKEEKSNFIITLKKEKKKKKPKKKRKLSSLEVINNIGNRLRLMTDSTAQVDHQYKQAEYVSPANASKDHSRECCIVL